jgi:hypothetical protein
MQVLTHLRRGVLSGDTASLLMWRLCSSSPGAAGGVVRPSLGRMLGSILQQRVPQRRLQVRCVLRPSARERGMLRRCKTAGTSVSVMRALPHTCRARSRPGSSCGGP